MTEQTATPTGEMPTTPAVEKAADNQTEAKPAVTVEVLQAELEAARKALKDANREAAERRKKLDAIEKAEKDKADAELSEAEKLRRELADATTRLKAAETDNLKRKVATETGLPAELIDRLRGDDEEALKADAKELLKLIPKAPKLGATNPGQAKQESIYDMGKRLLSEQQADIWTGGGVRFTDK